MKAITFKEYLAVAMHLHVDPSKVDYMTEGTSVISGNDPLYTFGGVTFKWIKEITSWECRHPVVINGRSGIFVGYCKDCKDSIEHMINKDSTKVKCKKCGKITKLEL
jgi:hypothetical protein